MKHILAAIVLCTIFGCSENGIGLIDTHQEGETTLVKFESKETLLPLTEGNWWKFSNDNGTETWSVTGDTVVDGNRYAGLYLSSGGYYESTGFYRVGENGTVYKLNLNGCVNAFYPDKKNCTYLNGDDSICVKSHEAVETPAGTFTNCLEFNVSPAPVVLENGNRAQIADADYSLTFKSGIGFVAAGNDWFPPLKLVEYSVVSDRRCNDFTVKLYPVRFDFQSNYDHTPIKLIIDGAVAYQGLLTTNIILSLAGSALLNLSEGTHLLRCMSGISVVDTEITVSDSLVVGINPGEAQEIELTFYTPGNFPLYY